MIAREQASELLDVRDQLDTVVSLIRCAQSATMTELHEDPVASEAIVQTLNVALNGILAVERTLVGVQGRLAASNRPQDELAALIAAHDAARREQDRRCSIVDGEAAVGEACNSEWKALFALMNYRVRSMEEMRRRADYLLSGVHDLENVADEFNRAFVESMATGGTTRASSTS